MNTEGQSRKEQDPPAPGEGPAPGGIGDTVAEHLARCVARLEDPALKPGWVVHEVRKDLKRVRALLRLSGDALRTRRLEKRCAAAGRELSHLRDAAALGETLARLRSRADPRQLEALEAVIEALGLDHPAAGPGLPRPIATDTAGTLRKVLRDCQALPFERMDAAAIDAGLAESWTDTARAFRSVVSRPALPRFHELRKAVKRELHQRELSGRPAERMERATLKKLADVLGELQDLDVLRERLREAGRWRGPVRKLVKQTIRELKARALRIGVGRYATGKS
jgi:CHAD domain-containing protein